MSQDYEQQKINANDRDENESQEWDCYQQEEQENE